MITIEVADSAGFCFGVRRAVDLAERAAGEGDAVTLGPLIHNRRELERLRALGLRQVDEVELADGHRVVVRAHGLPAHQLERLGERTRLENATCPHVQACQRRARRMAEQGYTLVVVGDRDHPETESIVSFASQGAAAAGRDVSVVVAADPADLGELEASRVAVVAQTTQSQQRLGAVVAACLERCGEVRAYNTICEASTLRQREARELAGRADLVLVVGDRQSANTGRLVEVCSAVQPRTRWVEQAVDVEPGWLNGVRRVAVTAGASTPDRVLREVVQRLEQLGGSVDYQGEQEG